MKSIKLVTPQQMKSLENVANSMGVSYERLMLNAGERLFQRLNCLINATVCNSVTFLCGNGNNAGDCFVAVDKLVNLHNIEHVTVAMLCGEPKTTLAKETFQKIVDNPKVSILYDTIKIKRKVHGCNVLCDGIFGTGFHGELPEHIQEVLKAVEASTTIAVDIPSGVNCNTGEVSKGTLRVDETITFGYSKLGMALSPAKDYCGRVTVVDIGITEEHYCTALNGETFPLTKQSVHLPYRSDFGNKGTFGRVLHVTGSNRMVGACIMASKSALRCGVGLVTISIDSHELLPLAMPEPIYIGRDCDSLATALAKSKAVLIGCGLGTESKSVETFKYVVQHAECPLIIDADGINILSTCIEIIKNRRVILTPHPLEMSRLTNLPVEYIQGNRVEVAVTFAKKYDCVVILKGANTIITDGKTTYVDSTANSGMSKGGSGDVLAGMVSSFVAQGMELLEASILSVYLHSQCGIHCSERLTKYSTLPTDLILEIPNAIKQLL